MDPSLGLLTCRAAPRGGGREKVPWAPRWLRRTNEGSAVGAARRWTKEGSVGGVRHAAAAAAAAAGRGKEGRRAPRWRRGGGGHRFVTCGGVTTEGEPALPRVAGLRPLPAVVRPTRGARAPIRGGSYLREGVSYCSPSEVRLLMALYGLACGLWTAARDDEALSGAVVGVGRSAAEREEPAARARAHVVHVAPVALRTRAGARTARDLGHWPWWEFPLLLKTGIRA